MGNVEQKYDFLKKRPFNVRNADEIELNKIMQMYVEPMYKYFDPFAYENLIIKGKMGSGKTMFLRANLAHYIFKLKQIIPPEEDIVIPVYVNLNDICDVRTASSVYQKILIKLLDAITQSRNTFNACQYMARIEKDLPPDSFEKNTFGVSSVRREIFEAKADEYVKKTIDRKSVSANITAANFGVTADSKLESEWAIKGNKVLEFSDIVSACEKLYFPDAVKFLFLIDEISSLPKFVFLGEPGESVFEKFMNQLRTVPNFRTKIAIYPHSNSDILSETRYGDILELERDIRDSENYFDFKKFAGHLIKAYCYEKSEAIISCEEIVTDEALQQILWGSGGNVRRLVHLLDLCTGLCLSEDNSFPLSKDIAIEALKSQAKQMIKSYPYSDQEFLLGIIKICKSSHTDKFTFANRTPLLTKFLHKSQEYNVLSVFEMGGGRKKTVFSFDYALCLLENMPTHVIRSSRMEIDEERQIEKSEIIKSTAHITDRAINNCEKSKIGGFITFMASENDGFIFGDDDNAYFFNRDNLILFDQEKTIIVGTEVLFSPTVQSERSGKTLVACDVELLDVTVRKEKIDRANKTLNL